MSLIWWLFVFSILFYPSFIILIIFTEKYPNTKFSKWWREHIIDRNEEYD
jgi:hypothetical protein